MKLNILGTNYEVIKVKEPTPYMFENSFSAYCDYKRKQIVLSDYGDDFIHEIIHAYLWESGLTKYALDETLVEWVAIQFPKIQATVKAVKKGG